MGSTRKLLPRARNVAGCPCVKRRVPSPFHTRSLLACRDENPQVFDLGVLGRVTFPLLVRPVYLERTSPPGSFYPILIGRGQASRP